MSNISRWHCEEVQDRILRPAPDRRMFDLHLSALEWSLVEPIIINDQADIKASNWRDRDLKPFIHQVQNLVTFCRRLPVSLIADDVGLGKTISAGLILSELISRRRVNRVLIICPKVLTTQWVNELDEKFGLVAKEASGAGLEAEIRRSTPIVVTTYHSASSRLSKIQEGTFDLCILDEAHELRNLYGSQKPPQMAMNVRQALERRPFKYVLMLTATPIQNKIWDLYSLLDLLKIAEGKPNPLGSPEQFAKRFLEPGSSGRKLNPDFSQEFQKIVRPSLTRTRRTDVKLNFPLRKIQMRRVELDRAEHEMIKVVSLLIEGISPLLQVSVAQAMMSSPRALVAQAENMVAKGSIEQSLFNQLRAISQSVPFPSKLRDLFVLIDLLKKNKPNDWRMVIFTVRRETQEMIGDALAKVGIPFGYIHGAAHEANNRAIANYKHNPPKVNVIISTDAGAEGINLQSGNVLINYDLPWNPMVVEQRIGRIQRLGSEFQSVVILNIVGAGTVEDRIVGRLTEKLQGVSQAIGDIEGILEAADLEPDEGEGSYENKIRKMVVDSLRGKDTSRAQKMFEENIQEAKDLFEERRLDLDQQLGGDPNEGIEVKRPPKIDRSEPKMPAKEFVLEAKKALGFEIRQLEENLYEATKPGTVPEKIWFEDEMMVSNQNGYFSENPVKSFLPGKPQFERLVQHWVDHYGHHVIDKSKNAKENSSYLAKMWCKKCVGLEYLQSDFTSSRQHFTGTVHIRVKAGTGVDAYEKILRGRLSVPPNHGQIKPVPDDQPLQEDLTLSQVMSTQFQMPIKRNVESNPEVGKFCDFYLNRLTDSLKQAGSDPIKKAKVESDFRPYVQADVLGIEGIRYQEGEIGIQYRVEGLTFTTRITGIPASGTILTEPELANCEITGFRVPLEILGKCAVTGRTVLRHRLITLMDGRLVLPDQVVPCSISGDPLLKSEAVQTSNGAFAKREFFKPCDFTGDYLLQNEGIKSDYSGLFGRRSRLVQSEISARSGFPEELVTCSVTGRKMFPDEGRKIGAEGLWCANDQLVKSAMSQKLCLPSEMAVCEKTGEKVHSEELEVCSISGKHVRSDLLVQSSASNAKFLPELGVQTSNGKFALPEEVQKCEYSGEMGLKTDFGVCEPSGMVVLEKYLLQSASTGKKYLRDQLQMTDDGHLALPEDIGTCAWDEKTTLKKQMVQCKLTENWISQRYANQDQQLKVLRELLDGNFSGESVSEDLARKVIMIPPLKAIKAANAIRVFSPNHEIYALVFHETTGWFAKKVHVFGCVMKTKPNGEFIVGKHVEGLMNP